MDTVEVITRLSWLAAGAVVTVFFISMVIKERQPSYQMVCLWFKTTILESYCHDKNSLDRQNAVEKVLLRGRQKGVCLDKLYSYNELLFILEEQRAELSSKGII